MRFNLIKNILLTLLMLLISACSDTTNETALLNLFTAANEDVIAINFPESTEKVLSINSTYDFSLQGLRTNGIDSIVLDKNIIWSLSANSHSTIDNSGHFIAGSVAEQITVNASFGHLNNSFEISVSAAKFDQIVALNDKEISIEMCQTQNINPIARYIDDNGNEEIRPLDSTLLDSITWQIVDATHQTSQKALIKVENQQTLLRVLSSGHIQAKASALSLADNVQKTSALFDVNIGNTLLNLKLCHSSDTDLNNCGISSVNLEQTSTASIIAVGRYPLSNGGDIEENISAASQWGLDNLSSISIAHSRDLQQINITTNTVNAISNISVACGDVTQNIQNIDIATGVILNEAVSCNNADINCLQTTLATTVNKLATTNIQVSVNNISLQNNQLLTLTTRPAEIILDVNALFSDSSQLNITADNELTYTLISSSPVVLSEKTGSNGVYTVLGSGRAEIQLQYRSQSFIVLIDMP